MIQSRRFQGSIAFLVFTLVLGTALAQNHRLNLQDAEIGALIASVSEITGRNFIIDPRVEGSVTVISSKPMTADEIYDVFLSVLQVHGYAAVPSGEFVKIVPDLVAHQDTIPTGSSGRFSNESLVTQVIAIEHVEVEELHRILRPFVPQNGHLIAHSGSNSLIISDRAGNVARLREIIRRIDSPSGGEIEVIPLQHAGAAEVVRTVNLLNESNPTTGAKSAAKVIADERTNSILLSGDPGARLRYKGLITHLDTPLDAGSTQVIHLQYADAESLVPILESSVSIASNGGKEGAPAATIQAHPETNALIISGPPALFRELAGIVKQLDIRRQQVLVEAIIAEVSSDFSKELGVQWQATELNSLNESGLIGGTNYPTNFGTGSGILGLGGDNGLLNLGGLVPGLNLGYLAGTIDVPTGVDANGNTVFQKVPQLGALVSALNADADTNVLSTPSIVTLDNQEAIINVGQEVPFVTGQFTNTGTSNSAVNPFQTIDRKDVGLTLTVTPHINQGDTIILNISQEVSSLSPQSGAVDLITNQREFTTTVMVPDNGMLVLGGLIDEDVRETIRKVPALGDIPVLGNLFKYRTSKRVKRNLMVFIRPRILRDRASVDSITGSRYNYMRTQQEIARDTYNGLQRAEDLPMLPDLNDYLNGEPAIEGEQ